VPYAKAQPVVRYHGTLTAHHGLWAVADNYGTHIKLRDANDFTITCRRSSATLVEMPRLTEKRAYALVDLWYSNFGRIEDPRTRRWLLTQKLVEADPDRPGGYRLTERGAAAMRSVRGWCNYYAPAR
jgi:hypothetical protein